MEIQDLPNLMNCTNYNKQVLSTRMIATGADGASFCLVAHANTALSATCGAPQFEVIFSYFIVITVIKLLE